MAIFLRVIGALFLLWFSEYWAPQFAGSLGGQADMGLAVLHTTSLVAACLLGAQAISRFLDAVLWNWFIPRQYGQPAPGLIADLVRVLIWLFTVGFLLARLSTQAATGIIATSSVGVAVVGFALRSLIADLFAGIAISLERPFHIGDWLELGSNGRGRVHQINWRSTHLEDTDSNLLIVPNSKLSEMVIRNTSRPTKWFIDRLTVLLDHSVTAHQVERILLSAAAQVPEVAKQKQPAKVRVGSYSERGIEWVLSFPAPTLGEASGIRYKIWQHILRNLHYAGITAPPQRHETYDPDRMLEPPNRGALNRAFLRRVDLFQSLTPEELDNLFAHIQQQLHLAKQTVVRQGDPGDSLFVLKEGLLNVLITDGEGNQRQVAQLQAGSFFGEMSLLTGAPRGASVVTVLDSEIFEIGRDALRPLLLARPAIADFMSQALASRQVANAKRLAESQPDAPAIPEQRNLAQQFLGRIRNLFGLAERV